MKESHISHSPLAEQSRTGEPYRPILRYFPSSPILNACLMAVATAGDFLMDKLFVAPLVWMFPRLSRPMTVLRLGR